MLPVHEDGDLHPSKEGLLSDQSPDNVQKKNKPPRLQSLDFLRGLTMAGMIIVDNQGNFDYVTYQLDEDFWNGIRLCNCIFPCFLFMMGTAIPLAVRAPFDAAKSKKVGVRCAKLFFIGLFLNFLAFLPKIKHGFRIMGILQRLGLAYGVCGAIYLSFRSSLYQRAAMSSLVVLYLACMYGLNVPTFNHPPTCGAPTIAIECGAGKLTEECNAAAYIDRAIFGGDPCSHWMITPNDPEGILTTITASLQCWFGVETGLLLTRMRTAQKDGDEQVYSQLLKVWGVGGMAVLVLGLVLGVSGAIPLNKKIWSLSFTLTTSGMHTLSLLAAYAIIDIYQLAKVTTHESGSAPLLPRLLRCIVDPMVWLGVNPIAIFIGMYTWEILALDWVTSMSCAQPNGPTNLWNCMYWKMFASSQWSQSTLEFASLYVSFLYLLLWTTVAWAMQRNGIYLKV
jgi:predicted acyltransferase